SDMGLFTTSTNVANELLAFQSPALIGDVIERLGLRANYVYKKRHRPLSLYGDSMVLSVSLPDISVNRGLRMTMTILEDGKVEVSDMRDHLGNELDGMTVTLGDTVSTPVGRMVISAGPNY
ncbi:MAG: chromosome partitioning protein ParA, partial [Paramuribaculum sp.]|nr:chromosome partitioning protein ParA [Paramuribaculum sp.]